MSTKRVLFLCTGNSVRLDDEWQAVKPMRSISIGSQGETNE